MKQMIAMVKNNWKAIVAGIVVVLLAVFLGTSLTKNRKAPSAEAPAAELPVAEAPAPVKTGVKKPAAPAATDARTYTEMVLAYKDRTIQFNDQCQASAYSTRVYKLGSGILLDNRSAKPATIKIGAGTYSLGGYGYKAVDLNTAGTFVIDCNAQQNVATISVQK